MGAGTLGIVAVELGQIVAVARERLDPAALVDTMAEAGIALDPDGVESTEVIDAVDTLSGVLDDIIEVAEQLGAGDTDDAIGSALSLIGSIDDVVAAITTLGDTVAGYADRPIPADFATRILEHAVVDLLLASDALTVLFVLFGVIDFSDDTLSDGSEVETPALHLDVLPDLISNPFDVLQSRFGWGTAVDIDELGRVVGVIARRLNVPSAVIDGHVEVLFADVYADGPGVRIDAQLPVTGSFDAPLRLGHPAWTATGSTDIVMRPGASLSLRPDRSPQLSSIDPDVAATVAVGIESTGPLTLLGTDDGPRLVAQSVAFDMSFTVAPNGVDVEVAVGLTGVRPLFAGSGDSFSGQFSGAEPSGSDMTLRWSASDGLSFDGTPRLTITIPGQVDLGPIWLRDWLVTLGFDAGAIELATSATVGGTIAVVDFEVEGLGLAAVFDFADPGPLPFALSLEPTWPTRVGMGIDAGAVQGAGFLAVDQEAGRYSGGLSIQILSIGVSALVIIDTELDGGSSWALFASLGIDIPGIPLGFGFTLEGLGGLLAIHRRLDADALAIGLRQGAIDAILFPDDPVNDAPILIPQIDQYFPIEADNFVVGPVIEIGWGTPTPLITAQIGVVLSFPQGLVAVMGSVSIELPTPEAPLIELNLDVLGVIDVDQGTVLVAASLYDSRLLGTIELSGDMAFYLATSPAPYFALSIGGWHPSFQPPDLLPSVFTTLRRMRAEISLGSNVRVTFDNYLAITSNTVQFGGRFEVVASVKVISTYTARGWFQFDVLLVFNPFQLIASVSAGVSVTKGDKELFGVSLSVTVRGPDPWFAKGDAQFKFFGIKVKFKFEIGGTAAAELPPRVDVLPLMRDQLAADAAWSVIEPGGIRPGLTLASELDGLLMPDSLIEVRQNVAPLGRTLERYGESVPVQREVSVAEAVVLDAGSGAPIPGVGHTPVDDWFAPSQYAEMRSNQRLSSASYEPMQAGVSFGLAGDDIPVGVAVQGGHETEIWEPEAPRPTRLGHIRHTHVSAGHFTVAAERVRSFGSARVKVPTLAVRPVDYHDVGGHRVPVHVEVPR